MAQVGIIINRRTADIHPHLAGFDTVLRLKGLHLLGQGVV
jgi:hypothetical protein